MEPPIPEQAAPVQVRTASVRVRIVPVQVRAAVFPARGTPLVPKRNAPITERAAISIKVSTKLVCSIHILHFYAFLRVPAHSFAILRDSS